MQESPQYAPPAFPALHEPHASKCGKVHESSYAPRTRQQHHHCDKRFFFLPLAQLLILAHAGMGGIELRCLDVGLSPAWLVVLHSVRHFHHKENRRSSVRENGSLRYTSHACLRRAGLALLRDARPPGHTRLAWHSAVLKYFGLCALSHRWP